MHPILFKIGPLTIYTYGLFVAIGFVAATYISTYYARKENIDKEKILDLSIYIFIGSLVGARLLYVLVEFKQYIERPLDIFKVWEGGLVFYGGLIGGLIIFFWYVKKYNFKVWKIIDIFTLGLVLGQGIGRIGCFFSGCCYGIKSNKFGVIFSNLKDEIPHIPTQIIESIGLFIIFTILINTKKKLDGEIFIKYIFYYGSFRFLIEFIRGDSRGPLLFSLISISQFVSIVLIIIAIFLFKKLKEKSGN
ncbi:MAG: prolipoprotein diacylglyceryl transferase [Candidatus Firestonebacteria bacterium]